MRTRGWGGNPPTTDAEAMARIAAAGVACIDAYGDEATLGMVAGRLGITRQTMYRYFPTSKALFEAIASEVASDLVANLGKHLESISSVEDALVEIVLFCARSLPTDPRLSFIVRPGGALFGATDAPAIAKAVLNDLDVDLSHLSQQQADDLSELMVRLLQALLLDPGTAKRDDADLSRFLHVCLDHVVHPPIVRS